MKKALIIIILLIAIRLFTGCEDWLNVNQDPNHMVQQPAINEAVYLIGVESEWAWQSICTFSWWWTCEDTQWLLWEAMPGANSSSFIIAPGFGIDKWNTYTNCLKHARNLYDLAKTNGNKRYQAIGATIEAWNWFSLTDTYDQIPLDEALSGLDHPHPKCGTQVEVYAKANGLLDEAISLFQDPSEGVLVPTSRDDYMMGADWSKWIKLCYSLKARQAMRLAYAEGKTATGQADLVLQYLANGMTSNSDECKWQHKDDVNGNNAWCFSDWLAAYSGKGQIPTNWLVDLMNSLNDPRRPIMFTEAQMGGFAGMQSGGSWNTGEEPSYYKNTYVGRTHPDYIMRYPECLYLKAEAYALKSDFASAQTALNEAVRAEMLGWNNIADFPSPIAPADIETYVAQLTLPNTVEGAQEMILTQKYLSGVYVSREPYFDYVRTGYPKFDYIYALKNPATGKTCPRRYLYPLDEMTNNENIAAIGQSNPLETGTAWDKKPGIGPRSK